MNIKTLLIVGAVAAIGIYLYNQSKAKSRTDLLTTDETSSMCGECSGK